jgi:hypothetical protein
MICNRIIQVIDFTVNSNLYIWVITCNKLKNQITISTIQKWTTLLLDDATTSNCIVEPSKTCDMYKIYFYHFFCAINMVHKFGKSLVYTYNFLSTVTYNHLKKAHPKSSIIRLMMSILWSNNGQMILIEKESK